MLKNLSYETFLVNGVISFLVALAVIAFVLLIMGVKLSTCEPMVLCGSTCIITCILWRASFFTA